MFGVGDTKPDAPKVRLALEPMSTPHPRQYPSMASRCVALLKQKTSLPFKS